VIRGDASDRMVDRQSRFADPVLSIVVVLCRRGTNETGQGKAHCPQALVTAVDWVLDLAHLHETGSDELADTESPPAAGFCLGHNCSAVLASLPVCRIILSIQYISSLPCLPRIIEGRRRGRESECSSIQSVSPASHRRSVRNEMKNDQPASNLRSADHSYLSDSDGAHTIERYDQTSASLCDERTRHPSPTGVGEGKHWQSSHE
jgi:hypothetical protein